jgi:hypothetical protein
VEESIEFWSARLLKMLGKEKTNNLLNIVGAENLIDWLVLSHIRPAL